MSGLDDEQQAWLEMSREELLERAESATPVAGANPLRMSEARGSTAQGVAISPSAWTGEFGPGRDTALKGKLAVAS